MEGLDPGDNEKFKCNCCRCGGVLENENLVCGLHCTLCKTTTVSGNLHLACYNMIHENNNMMIDHVGENLLSHLKFAENLYISEDRFAEALKKDTANYVLFVNPGSNKMDVVGTNLFEVTHQVDDDNSKVCPSFVSVVGPTGVGKSLILRALSHELISRTNHRSKTHNQPVPGRVGSSLSTSSDLHLYAGPIITTSTPTDNKVQVMFFDSEGLNGDSDPHSLGEFLTSVRRQVVDAVAYRAARATHVDESYPKLLYLFSDVMIFITTSNWRESNSILDPLLRWAQIAGTGIVNQPVKPKLIIIFNKVRSILCGLFKCFCLLILFCRWTPKLTKQTKKLQRRLL